MKLMGLKGLPCRRLVRRIFKYCHENPDARDSPLDNMNYLKKIFIINKNSIDASIIANCIEKNYLLV